jgi:hypothetical protein
LDVEKLLVRALGEWGLRKGATQLAVLLRIIAIGSGSAALDDGQTMPRMTVIEGLQVVYGIDGSL